MVFRSDCHDQNMVISDQKEQSFLILDLADRGKKSATDVIKRKVKAMRATNANLPASVSIKTEITG